MHRAVKCRVGACRIALAEGGDDAAERGVFGGEGLGGGSRAARQRGESLIAAACVGAGNLPDKKGSTDEDEEDKANDRSPGAVHYAFALSGRSPASRGRRHDSLRLYEAYRRERAALASGQLEDDGPRKHVVERA